MGRHAVSEKTETQRCAVPRRELAHEMSVRFGIVCRIASYRQVVTKCLGCKGPPPSAQLAPPHVQTVASVVLGWAFACMTASQSGKGTQDVITRATPPRTKWASRMLKQHVAGFVSVPGPPAPRGERKAGGGPASPPSFPGAWPWPGVRVRHERGSREIMPASPV